MLAIAVLVVVRSVGIEPRFILEEQEEVAVLPNLTEPWEGAEIGVVADLQIGMSTVPARFSCSPAIPIFELRSSRPDPPRRG